MDRTNYLLAQVGKDLGGSIGGEGLGPFAKKSMDGTAALIAITNIISAVIGVMTICAGFWFIFQFLIGGFNWIHSGGDKQKLHEARERITNAFVGLLVVVSGWGILAVTGKFTGIDFLISVPADVIRSLQVK